MTFVPDEAWHHHHHTPLAAGWGVSSATAGGEDDPALSHFYHYAMNIEQLFN